MAIQMTRAEYEATYGVKPVISASTLDTKPAPLRMTQAEYDALYGPIQRKEPGLLGKLGGRATDFLKAPFAEQGALPGTPILRAAGAVTGAAADVIGAAIAPAFEKTVDTLSNVPAVQKVATSVSSGLDKTNKAVEIAQNGWKSFEEANPNVAQDIRDVTNILSFLPVSKGVQVAGKTKVAQTVSTGLQERAVQKTADEIFNIENNYAKTRKANQYTGDSGDASRARVARSGVLVDAVDGDGTIRTTIPGGAVEKYKSLYLDGTENIVRKNLELQGETVPLDDIRLYLTREIGRSGLEGGDLVTALNGIQRELKGLQLRAKDGQIGLEKIQDSKLATTKNINFQTPPETAAYRKAVARAYKTVIEERSKKFNVIEVNEALAPYLQDIKRLENLDGRKVKGGRLGKYVAQGVGSLVGMGAGSVGGPIGAAIGATVGGEAASALKGASMARTFNRSTGNVPGRSAVLERAVLRIPDKKVMAPKGIKKTKEVNELEDDIAKNVEMQKKAIEKGDFTLVKALKEIYTSLVAQLKQVVKDLTGPDSQRGFANFFGDQRENKSRKNDLMSSQNQAPSAPKTAQSISDTVPDTSTGVNGSALIKNIPDDDLGEFIDFLDDVRAGKEPTIDNAIAVRRLAERYGVNPEQTDARLANAVARLLESEDSIMKKVKERP